MKRTMLTLVFLATATVMATAEPEGGRPRSKSKGGRPARMKLADRLEKLPRVLGLTEDQKAKAVPIIADFLTSHKALIGSLKDKLAAARNATRQAAKAMRKDSTEGNKKALVAARKANAEAAKPLRELTDKLVTDLSAILDKKQVNKLKAMFRRRRGQRPPGGSMPIRAILKLEGVTDDQKQKIQAIADQLKKDFAALRGGEAKPEPGQVAKVIKGAREKVMALLTDEQKAALGKMKRNRRSHGGLVARFLGGLNLTDEQKAQLKAARVEHAKAAKAHRDASMAKIKSILTAEQAKAFEAKLKEMRKNRRNRHDHSNRGSRPGRGKKGDAVQE